MFTAAFYEIAKKWKQPKCPSVDEQNVAHPHKGVYCLAVKRKEALTHVTAWMILETSC